ncbi:MAG: secretin N-terminal domain-containing protein, partial [Shimia sp.]
MSGVSRLLRLGATLACLVLAQPVTAQQGDGTFVINLRASDIGVLAEQVSAITGRTLVLDPGLTGEVTVVSAEPLDEDGVWALFQSILRVRGFVAVESGVVWQVIPEADARTRSASESVLDEETPGSQDVVTRLVRLNRLPAQEAVRVLRPLVDQAGYIEALDDPNAIVVSDTLENVERIVEIARTFDNDRSDRAEVIRFAFADAGTVANAITEVLGAAGTGARLSVDPSSNVLLVRGSPRDIEQIRNLARSMDIAPPRTPAEQVRTAIYALQFADAETVGEIVRATLTGAVGLTNPVAESVGAEGEETPPRFAQTDRSGTAPEVSIQASTETNSIIARGTERQLGEVAQLVKALDV